MDIAQRLYYIWNLAVTISGVVVLALLGIWLAFDDIARVERIRWQQLIVVGVGFALSAWIAGHVLGWW